MTSARVSTLLGTASLARRAGQVVRSESRRVQSGRAGCWDGHLTIRAIDDTRRERLVVALHDACGGKRNPPAGDGLLHVRASMYGQNLAVAAGALLSQSAAMLAKAGLDAGEILASTVTLEIRPAVQAPELTVARRRLAKLGRRLGSFGYGLDVSGADLLDVGARQRHGDRNYDVFGALTGVGADVMRTDAEQLKAVGVTPLSVASEDLEVAVDVQQVGTGLGALLLCARKLGSVLESASAQTALRLTAAPAGKQLRARHVLS